MLTIIDGLLLLSAWFGHAATLTVALNRVYAYPLSRRVLRNARRLTAVAVFAFPPAAYWLTQGQPSALLQSLPHTLGDAVIVTWLGVCWLVSGVGFPLVTLARWLRRTPSAVVAQRSRTIDIAAKLGYKPVGQGAHRQMAQAPFNGIFHLELREVTVRLPGWPTAWDGLTLLHLSDIHLCGTPDRPFYDEVIALCRQWGTPDLLALTGDIVDSPWHHRWILPVLGQLAWREAGLAILGNHDLYHGPERVRRRLRRLGFHDVGNRWHALTIRGQPLVVIGHEGPWFRPEPDLSDCPEGYRLGLAHTPDQIEWARRHAIGLLLAGHVHGGQIRVPPFGSIFVPSRYSRRYDCGLFDESPTLMVVSRGLAGREPLRYFCPPQAIWLTLCCELAETEAES